MRSIRLRLFLLFTLTITVTCGLAYLSIDSFYQYSEKQKSLNISYQIEEIFVNAEGRRIPSHQLSWLKEQVNSLTPVDRKKIIESALDAHESGRFLTFYRQSQFFRQNESIYREHIRTQAAYLEGRVIYYGLIYIAGALGFLVLTILYLQSSMFLPLRSLRKEMTDFLEQRYTYQFKTPSPNEVGQLQSTFHDLAQKVLQHMEELQSLDQAKSDFLSIASHELRTPLTSLKGSLGLLRSGVAGEVNDMTENLVLIAEEETDRLIRLINDLLDLAKIEAQQLPLDLKWIPLSQLIGSTISSLKGLSQSAKVELVEEGLEAADVFVDQDRIQQVLTNLLSNAIKYSPEGGCVQVTYQVRGDQQLVIQVKDEGKGISPDDQRLIFQKFRQVTSSQNPLVKGTGLGLAIAKAIVAEHKGEIGVHSKPGQGSVFFFTLPTWRHSLEEVAEAA